ncbi:MAG: DNA polymerase I [Candidatus Saccharimonadales bacterium]
MTKRLVIIDGKSIFYRGYFAMPGLSTKDGTPTGGVFGFASLAIEIIKKLDPDYVCVAWDKKGTSIRKRLEILPTYKAGRKTPPQDFFEQIPILHELLDAFSWPLYECDDYEADDIMGTLAKKAEKEGIETCLISSDLDMLQLVSPLTHMYAMKKGLANIELYNPESFEEKYGIQVEQFLDLKALKGDTSDNIPGVPGVGEKTATTLLQEYGTLDAIYEHLDDIKPAVSKKLVAGKDSAYMSKKVAELMCDAPVPLDLDDMNVHDVDAPRLKKMLAELEFHSLVRRLPEHMLDDGGTNGLFVEQKMEPLDVVSWTDEVSIDEAVVLHVYEAEVWLSLKDSTVMRRPLAEVSAQVWQTLGMSRVVGYDVKTLLHTLAEAGVQTAIDEVHDIRQAAFLLDPLQRDRSIAGLLGAEVDETDPGSVMAALWSVYRSQQEMFAARPTIARIATELDFPLVRLLFDIEQRGVKIDSDYLASLSTELEAEYAKLQQEIYNVVGYEFNIGSPMQLSEVLFTKLQLPTTGIKKGKTGYSTGQKELDKLRGQHPIIELIERTREIAKMRSTYIDALPKLVDENGRLHTTFHQDVAATGRLSSTQPNLQNIPTRSELGKRVREAFIAEPGNVLVSADYSQFELRLAAILAGDTKMIEDFNSDLDIHVKTASDVWGIPMEAVTKDQRRAAKVINFGVLYGMSPHGLSVAANMSLYEAKQFIDQYFTVRKPIRDFIDATLAKAEEDGYVETYYGRRRPTPDIKSSNYMVREGAKRAAANMPIQGTEADLMKRAMLRVEQKIGTLGMQILQIHDSILVECPAENAAEISAILQHEMEAVAPELAIRLKVDVSTGETWGTL